jgi:hypothetical protein
MRWYANEQVQVTDGIAELAGLAAEVRVPVSLAGAISARLDSLGEDAAAAYADAQVREAESIVAHCRGLVESDPDALMAAARIRSSADQPLYRRTEIATEVSAHPRTTQQAAAG